MDQVKHRRRRGYTRVSRKHQATLPVDALRQAGLSAGDELMVEAARAGRIVLVRADDLIERGAPAPTYTLCWLAADQLSTKTSHGIARSRTKMPWSTKGSSAYSRLTVDLLERLREDVERPGFVAERSAGDEQPALGETIDERRVTVPMLLSTGAATSNPGGSRGKEHQGMRAHAA